MWAFGTSLALFGCGNLLILAPDPAFFIAGGLCFALGAVICTGSTIWALHLQWQARARRGCGGRRGASQCATPAPTPAPRARRSTRGRRARGSGGCCWAAAALTQATRSRRRC